MSFIHEKLKWAQLSPITDCPLIIPSVLGGRTQAEAFAMCRLEQHTPNFAEKSNLLSKLSLASKNTSALQKYFDCFPLYKVPRRERKWFSFEIERCCLQVCMFSWENSKVLGLFFQENSQNSSKFF